MNEFPYMPLYWNDLLSDNKVRVMSTEEFGAYMRLLGVAWHEDSPGKLPDNQQDLARLAGVNHPRWSEVSRRVLACFKHDKMHGCYIQKRMVAEYKKLCTLSEKRRMAGARGNASRWKKGYKDLSQCDDLANRKCLARPSQSELESESKSEMKEVTKVTSKLPQGCELPIPECLAAIDGFSEAWRLFCCHRSEINKPITPTTGDRILGELAQRPAQSVKALMLAVDGGWRRFDWKWVDNAQSVTFKPPGANSSTVQAGEAELGNARMAYYTANGEAPFGMKSEDLLSWFSNHLAAAQAA